MIEAIPQRVHLVGVGGIHMSAIARILRSHGHTVTGSDLRPSPLTQRLESLGVTVHAGHDAGHLGDAELVVYTSAAPADNPELVEAQRRGIPAIKRAEMVARLMEGKRSIAVAGSHGKTTTTSMIATVLSAAGLDPTVVIGGRVKSLGGNARLGQGEILVAEADESDGTFLLLSPTIAVVTNIDREHMDFYQTMERLTESFLDFINQVPFYGLAILCLDHPNVRALLPKMKKRFVTYGFSPEADFIARDLQVRPMEVEFSVARRATNLGKLRLHLPGRHSASNALAAVAVAQELEVPFSRTAEALESFAGIHRRFEIKGEPRGILVIDDYGHHPVEIRATIEAIRDSWKRPLTVVFQPHRYTRTSDLFDDFLTCFEEADRLVLTEIYSAGEEAIAGTSGKALCQAIQRRGHLEVEYVADRDEIARRLLPKLKSGDIVLTLGAGDIYKVGEEIIETLGK